LKTSQLPRHPSRHRVQIPDAGATLLDLFEVSVASFAFGCWSVMPSPPKHRASRTPRKAKYE
jgi:hypothetical protein